MLQNLTDSMAKHNLDINRRTCFIPPNQDGKEADFRFGQPGGR